MFYVVPTQLQGAFTCVCFVCVLCPCTHVYVSCMHPSVHRCDTTLFSHQLSSKRCSGTLIHAVPHTSHVTSPLCKINRERFFFISRLLILLPQTYNHSKYTQTVYMSVFVCVSPLCGWMRGLVCLCWAPLLFPDLHHHVPRRATIGGGKVNVVPNSSEVFGADGRGPPQTTHCHTSHTTYQPHP